MKTQCKTILIVFISVLLVYCNKDDDTQSKTKSSEKELISFIFKASDNNVFNQDINGTIDQNNKTVSIVVPNGVNITALEPTIVVSPDATIAPEGSQDFTNPVFYEITAEDGTKETYTATITITPSDQKQILSFVFMVNANGQLNDDIEGVVDENNKTIFVTVPNGTNTTTLEPNIVVSPDATITPEGSQDFTNPVTYTLTAQDGSKVEYVITVINVSTSQRTALIAIYNANSGNTLGWDLNDSDISNWDGVDVDGDGYISELSIDNKSITAIPPQIDQLIKLEYLLLHNNQLSSVPEEIGQLTNLYELYLDDNQLSTIPEEIGQLTNLTRLGLSGNRLNVIPAEIGQLTNLTELSLFNNQLKEIPPEIGLLNDLEYLYLSTNQLASVPTEINELINLTELYLSGNQLKEIPTAIGQLTNLTRLHLFNNQLKEIPEEIGQLTSLTLLSLNNNQLTSIPVQKGFLINLTQLYLEDNQLTAIPKEIGQLIKLDRLYLNNNQLTTIPKEVCDLETNYGTVINIDNGVICQ